MLEEKEESDDSDEIVFESCVIPHDEFLSLFDSLANDQCERVRVLLELRDFCLSEQLPIDKARFSALMQMAQPPFPKSVKKAALKLMIALTKLKADVVRDMIPENLVDVMYSLLMRPRAFKVIENLVDHFHEPVIARLLELGVIDLLGERINLRRANFETALSLLALILEYDIAKPHAYSLVTKVLEAVAASPRHEEWVEAVISLGIISRDPVVAKLICDSTVFSNLFTRNLVKTSNKIAVLRLLIALSKHDCQCACHFMSLAPIQAFVASMLDAHSHRDKCTTCLCDFFFLLAQEEQGREFLASSSILARLFETARNTTTHLTSHIVLVLAQVAMTTSPTILDQLISSGYIDIISVALGAIATKASRVVLNSILNIIRMAESTGRTDILNAIAGNCELVDAIKECTTSTDEVIFATSHAITSQLDNL